jgi:hypothetical protein
MVTIPGVWVGDDFTAHDGENPVTIVIETDGIVTGTTIKINGKPVSNCSAVEFRIDVETMLAKATITLDAVPIKFTGTLAPDAA